MTLAAPNSKLRRRDVIGGIHAAVAVIVLVGAVSAAHFLIGLPDLAAVWVGGLVGYILANVILRYLVPRVPSISDAERLQMRIGRRWLIWTVAMTLFLHFAAPLPWVISFGAAAASGLLGWVMERRKKSQARTRLCDTAKQKM